MTSKPPDDEGRTIKPFAATTDAPTVLWGLQCTDPHHEGHGYGRVYCHSRNRSHITGLADSVACYQLVVSDDGGQTWARADA